MGNEATTRLSAIYTTLNRRADQLVVSPALSISLPLILLISSSLTLAIILLRLPHPLQGDTSLFLTFARGMAEGDVLYRDLWDIKPPGVIGFYYLGGKLLGFHPISIRIFDALYHITLTALLMWALRPWITSKLIFGLLPLFLCGGYFAVSTSSELTQAEALASPLLGLMTLTAARMDRAHGVLQWRWAMISGMAIGLACLMKPVFALVAIFVWATLGVIWWRRQEFVRFLRLGISAAAVSLLPLLLTYLLFALHGAVDDLTTVLFVDPLNAFAQSKPNWPALKVSLSWMLRFLPGLALSIALIYTAHRKDDRILLGLMSAWAFGLAISVGIQINSWWVYHFILFYLPIIIIVALGLDRAHDHLKEKALLFLVTLAFALVPYAVLYRPILSMVETGYPLSADRYDAYALALNDRMTRYPSIIEYSAPYGRGGLQGERVFIFGNPAIYQRTGSLQAIRVQGWCPELFAAPFWEEIEQDLARALPNKVFVQTFYMSELLTVTYPGILTLLEENYDVTTTFPDGSRWYERKAAL